MRETQHQLEIKQRNDKIIELVKSGVRCLKIAKDFGLTFSCIKLICKKNNVIVPKQLKGAYIRYPDRDKKIIELIEKGVTYDKISTQFKISKQRVSQIALTHNSNSNKIKSEKYKKEIEEINEQIKNGAPYQEVYKNRNIQTLRRYGLKNKISFFEERNKKIIKLYKEGFTAKEIIEKGLSGRIKDANRIYQIVSMANSRKFPNMVRKKKGYINESGKILKLILKMKQENFTQKEISDYLNDNNYRTVSNKKFTPTTVGIKYIQYLRSLK